MEAFKKFITTIALMTPDGSNAARVYGAFHFCFMLGTLAVCILLCIFCRNLSEKRLRVIITAAGCTLILLEVYKQLVFTFASGDTAAYNWSEFPFQFCSTPMYVAPIAGLMKKGRLRDMCMSYLSTFSMTAGFIVMAIAGGVFNTPSLGVAIQTMVYHGGMLALGVLIAASERDKLGFKYWLKSLPLFGALFTAALILNVIFYYALPNTLFDLYYISPFYVTAGLPVATELKTALMDAGAVFVYIIAFFAAFAAASLAAAQAAKGTYRLCRKLSGGEKL